MNSVKAEDGKADKFRSENDDTKKLIDEVLNYDAQTGRKPDFEEQ